MTTNFHESLARIAGLHAQLSQEFDLLSKLPLPTQEVKVVVEQATAMAQVVGQPYETKALEAEKPKASRTRAAKKETAEPEVPVEATPAPLAAPTATSAAMLLAELDGMVGKQEAELPNPVTSEVAPVVKSVEGLPDSVAGFAITEAALEGKQGQEIRVVYNQQMAKVIAAIDQAIRTGIQIPTARVTAIKSLLRDKILTYPNGGSNPFATVPVTELPALYNLALQGAAEAFTNIAFEKKQAEGLV